MLSLGPKGSIACSFGRNIWRSCFVFGKIEKAPPKKSETMRLTQHKEDINISASVDITVSWRVVEGLARWYHGNRPRMRSRWPGAKSSLGKWTGEKWEEHNDF
jgi:hypothetical protein